MKNIKIYHSAYGREGFHISESAGIEVDLSALENFYAAMGEKHLRSLQKFIVYWKSEGYERFFKMCIRDRYMCEAVKNVAPRYGDRLTWRESLIKSAAGIKRTMALGVATLPTLLINNEVVFDNITPTEDALIKEIEKRL